MRGPLAFTCIQVLLFGRACADVLALDDARPWLVSDGTAVDWASGGGAFLLASNPVVRVNYRGIITEAPGAVLRDLASLGWARANCNLSAHGLCASEFGTTFPIQRTGPRSCEDTPGQLPPDWAALRCRNADGRVLTHEPVYDLSACDVLDEGADVLYSAGVLYYRRSDLAAWAYWTLIVGAILLVRGLSQNVRAHREARRDGTQSLPLGASVVCLLVVSHEGSDMYATEADHVFYVATMLYCMCYLGYHAYFLMYARALSLQDPQPTVQAPQPTPDATRRVQPPIFNLAAGVLQLIVSRLYTGAESPYNPIILLILCTRAITKLLQPSAAHAATGLLDATYIALACELGFLPDPAYLCALIACAYLVSEIYFARCTNDPITI